jgi:hypothetical protein
MKENEMGDEMNKAITFFIIKSLFSIPLIFITAFFLFFGWNTSIKNLFPALIEKKYISESIKYISAVGVMTIIFSIKMFIAFLTLKINNASNVVVNNK